MSGTKRPSLSVFRAWVALLALTGLAACSSGEVGAPSVSTAAAQPQSVSPFGSGGAGSSTGSAGSALNAATEPSVPPAGSPEQVRDAVAVVEVLAGELPLSDVERRCVGERLAGDAGLVGRLAGGTASLGVEDRGVVEDVARRCVQAHSFAEGFVQAVRDDRGEVTDDQVGCLRREFGTLSPQQMDQVNRAGQNPADPGDGAAMIDRIVQGCVG